MEITRIEDGPNAWRFLVHVIHIPDARFEALVGHLRAADIPFKVGAPLDDPNRALTIGPLDDEAAVAFAARWLENDEARAPECPDRPGDARGFEDSRPG